jgi:hypothetical protein
MMRTSLSHSPGTTSQISGGLGMIGSTSIDDESPVGAITRIARGIAGGQVPTTLLHAETPWVDRATNILSGLQSAIGGRHPRNARDYPQGSGPNVFSSGSAGTIAMN